MTSFNIGPELTACTPEELGRISRHLEDLQEQYDLDRYDADDLTALPEPLQMQLHKARHLIQSELDCRQRQMLEDLMGRVKAKYATHRQWGPSLHSLAVIASQQANDDEEWSNTERALWQAISVAAVEELETFGDFIKEVEGSMPPMRQADDDS